jgi:nucleotidyltransferase substrate binding protein (TIGR01987 family)
MSAEDIRWIQRFNHFQKALAQLQEADELAKERSLTNIEKQGFIKAFEFTHELAWNTLKDFLEQRGVQDLYGSRDATREAFQVGLIENGQVWMDMIKDRNLTSHTYNESTANKIAEAILDSYLAEFEKLKDELEKISKKETNGDKTL